jgi:predicted kinase
MTLATIIFIVVAQAAFLTDDTRAMLRALARAHGCMTPSISAQSRDGGMIEITVTCLKPGEDGS